MGPIQLYSGEETNIKQNNNNINITRVTNNDGEVCSFGRKANLLPCTVEITVA